MDLKDILEKILEENKKYFLTASDIVVYKKIGINKNDNVLESKKEILRRLSELNIEKIEINNKYILINDCICIQELKIIGRGKC